MRRPIAISIQSRLAPSILLLLALVSSQPAAAGPSVVQEAREDSSLTRLLRYPDIHRDRISQSLEIKNTTGGEARSHQVARGGRDRLEPVELVEPGRDERIGTCITTGGAQRIGQE